MHYCQGELWICYVKTIKLEELLIENGIEISKNIMSLKNLAPGYRTFKKLTKEDILIDIEKTKCMLRRIISLTR